jgi:hypothetical protein
MLARIISSKGIIKRVPYLDWVGVIALRVLFFALFFYHGGALGGRKKEQGSKKVQKR